MVGFNLPETFIYKKRRQFLSRIPTFELQQNPWNILNMFAVAFWNVMFYFSLRGQGFKSCLLHHSTVITLMNDVLISSL